MDKGEERCHYLAHVKDAQKNGDFEQPHEITFEWQDNALYSFHSDASGITIRCTDDPEKVNSMWIPSGLLHSLRRAIASVEMRQ